MAVNIDPRYPLDDWVSFWRETGAGEVLLGQDTTASTIKDYQLVALGTEVIVGRQGRVEFRSNGSAGYKKLKSEIENAL